MATGTRLDLAEARMLIEQGQSDEALERLRSLDFPPRLEPVREIFQGVGAFRQAELQRAESHIAQALERQPDNRLAANWRAVVRARRGELEQAVRDLLAAGLVPYNEILLELALIYENHLLCHPRRRPPTGLDDSLLRAIAEGDLSSAPPPRRLGRAGFERAYTRCRFDALLRHAIHCLGIPRLAIEGRMVLIHCLSESNLTEEALTLSRRLTEENSSHPMIQSQLGLCAVRAGLVGEALLALSRVGIEGPEDFNCHWHLGLAALRAGDEGEARWFFQKALRDHFIGSFEDSWSRLWWTITSEHFLAHRD